MSVLITEKKYESCCDDYRGFCTKCQKFTRGNCEPDATDYECPKCKTNSVMGAEEAMMEGHLQIK